MCMRLRCGRAWRIHSLEIKARTSTRRVAQVVIADLAVTKQRAPERQHVLGDEYVDRDVDVLNGGRFGHEAQALRGSGDLPGQPGITGLQADGNARISKVDIEILPAAGEPTDLADERDTFLERASPEVG
jgi:hypothetical protein